jgi:hypothetical protein
VLTWRPLRFTPWGIVSGIFWVPAGLTCQQSIDRKRFFFFFFALFHCAGAAYVVGVEHAGLAINQVHGNGATDRQNSP